MQLEFRHLRAVRAISETGSLSLAAERLHMTQSALSHQVRGLEEQVGLELFVRRARPLRLSFAGERLLELAERVLPMVEDFVAQMTDHQDGEAGRLSIAIECHACFEWLFPALEHFRQDWPKVDIDIRPGLAFDALDALVHEQIDVVISSDPKEAADICFVPLFTYKPTFVVSSQHPLTSKAYIEPEDLRNETLITYPVEKARLDVFSQFLAPAQVEPRAIRQVELTSMILLLVASGRGITVLPDWVLQQENFDLTARPLTAKGITRQLFAACRAKDVEKDFMQEFFALASNTSLHQRER